MLADSEKVGKRDRIAADRFLAAAAEVDYAPALAILGKRNTAYGVKDPAQIADGVKMLEKAAEAGDKDGLVGLGDYFSSNDKRRAEALYLRAVPLDMAHFNLAFLYEQGGSGIARSAVKAFDQWQQAANAGPTNLRAHEYAVLSVAQAHYYGYGTARDTEKAYLRVKNESGPGPRSLLGWLLFWGHGVNRDEAKAVQIWTELFAEAKAVGKLSDLPAYASVGLGAAYELGRGVEKNELQAKELFGSSQPYPLYGGDLRGMLLLALNSDLGRSCGNPDLILFGKVGEVKGGRYEELVRAGLEASVRCHIKAAGKHKRLQDRDASLYEAARLLAQTETLGTGASVDTKRMLTLASANGGVMIGMSKTEVLASKWGKPSDVNRTITEGSSREQWVYGRGKYLYFDNGVLSAIQD